MNTTHSHAPEDIAALLAPSATSAWGTRLATWIIVATLIAGLGVAVRRYQTAGAATAAPAYVTEMVTRGNLDVRVSATGNLQPTNTVNIGSELSGLVEAVFVDENAVVRKGQVLARLDTLRLQDQITRSEATLASAEARLAQAAATVTEATASLARFREVSRLSGGKVPSTTEMDGAIATLARAEGDRLSAAATVTDARATLSSDRTNLAKATIRSPIDGIVLARAVEPGQTVAASLQVATLFTIAEDLRKMELAVDVDEADVGVVREDQAATFTVDAYPDRQFPARTTQVRFGSETVDGVVTYKTVLKVDNSSLSLRPGMTATAQITVDKRENVLLVPNTALRFMPPQTHTQETSSSAGGLLSSILPHPPPPQSTPRETVGLRTKDQHVWVLREGQLTMVPITKGLSDGRMTEVTGGALEEGMDVVTDTEATAP